MRNSSFCKSSQPRRESHTIFVRHYCNNGLRWIDVSGQWAAADRWRLLCVRTRGRCVDVLQYALFLVLMVTAEIALGVVIAVMHEQVRITRSADQLNCLAVLSVPDHPRLRLTLPSIVITFTSSFVSSRTPLVVYCCSC